MQYDYTIAYAPKRNQTVFTPPLADGDVVSVSFTTPADMKDGGKGGSIAFVNQGQNTGSGNQSNTLIMRFQKAVVGGQLSGSIGFNRAPLAAATAYTFTVTTEGPAPDGIRIKLTGR